MTRRLGRFELGEQIDAGGFTTVYRAIEDLGQGITRPAAVKILQSFNPDEEEQIEGLRREVEVLVELGGAPNIVSILATGIDQELGAWIAMALEGKSLVHSIGVGPAEPDQVRVLLRDALNALAHMHGAEPQILHRDLKPQNILSSHGLWKVSDFGLAKRRGAEETMALATVKYAAPELLDATLGGESPSLDLYALGMVAYEYALGSELFRKQFPSIYDPAGGGRDLDRDDRPKWMYWHTSQQMTLPPIADLVEGYPEDLSVLIAAMTAKPVAQRIASAEDALERLGVVGTIVPNREPGEEEPAESSRRVSPVIAITATIVILAALVSTLMWTMLGGRTRIELAFDGRFQGTGERIQVTGVVENNPPAGRAEIQLRRGSVRTFAVACESDGRFTCNVRLQELGTFPATMVVKDRSGVRVARAALELVRVEPATVQLEFQTSPVVKGVTVLVRGSGGEAEPITLTTDASGSATTPVSFGGFFVDFFHPRYEPLEKKQREQEQQTGIDEVRRCKLILLERDFAVLRRDMQREVDRLLGLMEKKTNCPPGPLDAEEEDQVRASIDRLRQLADGDLDMELFLDAVENVTECDPASMVAAPELPPAPPGAEGGSEGGRDPAVQVNRLIARIEKLIDQKVNCPPGPLSAFQEETLERSLEELTSLARGDIDLLLYIDEVERVVECDPDSRPDPEMVPHLKTRTELEEERRPTELAVRNLVAETTGETAEALRGETERFLQEYGLNTNPGTSASGGSETASTKSVIDRVLAKVPPNPGLVARLMAMPLAEFTEFVRSNVPTGAVEVIALDEVNLVRVRGPLFRTEELELMTVRLAYGMARIQPELRVDPWDVCRGLSSALTASEATGVRVDAFLVPSDPTLFVQFEQTDAFDRARAKELAETFVVDLSLLWVRGYVDLPATRPDRQAGEIR